MIRPITMPQQITRDVRRRVFALERKERASGKWSPWEIIKAPALKQFDGWMHDIHTVAKNNWIAVMIRDVPTSWGIVKHAAIRTAMNAELGWAEKHRLKNEIFGADATALEVMPPAERVIDAADMYHLWILPAGMTLPFGLHHKDPGSGGCYRPGDAA